MCDDEGRTCLVLHGAVTVGAAIDLHEAARAVAGAAGDVEVVCEFVETLDLSAWQILLALHRALVRQDRRLRLTSVPAALRTTADRCGLTPLLLEPEAHGR